MSFISPLELRGLEKATILFIGRARRVAKPGGMKYDNSDS